MGKMFIYLKTAWIHRKQIRLLKLYLYLLHQNIRKIEEVWKGNRADRFLDCYLIITNRMIIDVKGALELTKNGYYGSAYSLIAGLYRTLRMLAALHAKPSLWSDYLDEDVDTYQKDKSFFSEFKEGALIEAINEAINSNFGGGVSQKTEIEKLLHGSGFATRKFYAKRIINPEGLRTPQLRFSAFYEQTKAGGILNLLQGFILDNIGIFLEQYQTRPEAKEFTKIRKIYFMFLNKAGIK